MSDAGDAPGDPTTDRIGDRSAQFAGGMQMRLQIARDRVTGSRLLDLLRDQGPSAIMVTHGLAVVRCISPW